MATRITVTLYAQPQVPWTKSTSFGLMQQEQIMAPRRPHFHGFGADVAKNEADMQAASRSPDRVERGLGMGCA
jgi:hypothetical protein